VFAPALIGLVMAALATISGIVAANVVSPSYDFSNALPKLLNSAPPACSPA
jgi:NCS1 family nucleobase:cation symporter-1